MTRLAAVVVLAIVAFTAFPPVISAQGRKELTINDTSVTPENLTSSKDGTVYFGSMSKGTIYRAAPGATFAEPWILASATGLTRVLGVLADDSSNTLWVCQNATGGRNGAPVVGQTALRSFDLKSGAAKGTYPFPANPGTCNDIAVSADGSVYVSESFRGRVHRLKPNAASLEIWAADSALNIVDGLALLGDGALYVNNFGTGKLFRIPIKADGSAGALVAIETSMPLIRPDGMRRVGPRTLLQAEQQGRIAELTIVGDRAEVRVLQDGLTRAAGVTLIPEGALVLIEMNKAVVVPYRVRPPQEQEVMRLSRDKWRWMAERSIDSLAVLFHDQAVFVHMGGTMSKAQELEVIRSGGSHYKHAEILESSVRFVGTTAVVLNRIRLVAVVGGNEVTNPFVVTEVYVPNGSSWKLASMSFTRLLGQ